MPNMGSLARLLGMLVRSPARVASIALPSGAAAYVASTDDPRGTVQLTTSIPLRLARDIWAAAATLADYKWTLRQYHYPSTEYNEALRQCHQRGAERLLRLCFANGGIYIKLGQHIGQLDHLLPDEYVTTMRAHLLDRCPVSSPQEVRRIIETDLGLPVEQLFASFDWNAVASASLAQVHIAYDHSGQKLAVKVQHEGLRESSSADIYTIEALVRTIRYLVPTFDYIWLVDETKLNLPKELDFLHEISNAERCRANLSSPQSHVRGKVVIPAMYPSLSSHRVLTMDFMEGVKVTDLAALSRLGISPSDVAQIISQTFNEMIFLHGDVHCDPHAANLLVRRVPYNTHSPASAAASHNSTLKHGSQAQPSSQQGQRWSLWGGRGRTAGSQPGQWQLVLLDHGLYRQIDSDVRHHYAGLWRSMIFGDVQGIKHHAAGLNAGDSYVLFAAMLTSRPWDEIVQQRSDKLYIPRSQEDKEKMQGYVGQFAKEITDLLLRMPRPLLLMLKTNDCLRSIDWALGQPVNTFTIVARECSRALAEQRAMQQRGLRSALTSIEERIGLEMRVFALRALTWFYVVRQQIHRLLFGDQATVNQ